MFGAGDAAGPTDETFTLFDQSWNAGGTFGGKTHVSLPLGFDPTPDEEGEIRERLLKAGEQRAQG